MDPKLVSYRERERETNVKKTFSVLMIVFLLSVKALSYFYCLLISMIYNVNEP